MGSQSLELVNDLVKFKVFKDVVDKAHQILLPHNFSVYDLFYKSDENTFKSILNVTVTIAIVQVISSWCSLTFLRIPEKFWQDTYSKEITV